MRKRILRTAAVLMAALLALLPAASFARVSEPADDEIWDGSIAAEFAGGVGAEEDPYRITNGAELAYLAQQVNSGRSFSGEYLLIASDIWLNDMTDFENWSHENRPENAWPPIGTPDAPFSGNIRAAGWIGGVFIDMPETDNVGLFGFVSADSSFDWITLSGAYIRGNDRVGGLFGSCESENVTMCGADSGCRIIGRDCVGGVCGYGGSYTDCHCGNCIVSGRNSVGGIIGSYGYAESCIASCTLFGQASVGGIIGRKGSAVLCEFAGENNGNNYVGGIVGRGDRGFVIENCRNFGTLNGNSLVGGICGSMTDASIDLCSNSGAVTGNLRVAGIVGQTVGPCSITRCWNKGAVTGVAHVGGIAGELCALSGYTDGNGYRLENCYNAGSIDAVKPGVGGIAGDLFYPSEEPSVREETATVSEVMRCCYNVGAVSGPAVYRGGIVGCCELTEWYEGTELLFTGCYYLDSSCCYSSEYGQAVPYEQLVTQSGLPEFDFEEVWEFGSLYQFPQLRGLPHNGTMEYGFSVIHGDVNADGAVDIADALIALRCSMGLLYIDPIETVAADMDRDEEVTAADALLILRLSMGLNIYG